MSCEPSSTIRRDPHDLSLDDLIDAGEFTRRHTSPTADERRHMLA